VGGKKARASISKEKVSQVMDAVTVVEAIAGEKENQELMQLRQQMLQEVRKSEERSDSKIIIPSSYITNKLTLVDSLLAIPHPNPFCASLRSSQHPHEMNGLVALEAAALEQSPAA